MKALSRMTLAAVAALLSAAPVRADDGPLSGEVTAVSVMPAPGRAEIVVNVHGTVDVKDFMLQNPDRLVLDVVGAHLNGATSRYDGVNRGGVRNLRYNQFRPDVVRIVLELDAAKDYKVTREGDAIRVSFGSDRTFLSWSSTSPADLTPPVPHVAAPRQAQSEVSVPDDEAPRSMSQGAPRITVSWDRASIGEVIAGFAAFSGRNIILGKDIKGEVTAEIKNQPWPEAFAAVLAAQGLTAQEMPGGIIRVDAPSTLASLDSTEPLETAIVRINYKQADSLAPTVATIVTKRGRVIADKGSNSLVVTDTHSHIGQVTDFVRGLDIRTPQVSIQAKIIFVDRTDLQQLGIRYDLGSRTQFFNKLIQRPDPSKTDGSGYPSTTNIIDLGGNSLSAIGNADATVQQSALDLVFSTAIGGFSLTSFLSALETVQLSDVQAEPLITTLDNREADILVGDEIPLRVVDASSAQGGAGAGAPRSTVQFKEVGIRLTVTPHVTNNRQVLLTLQTERSQVQTLAAADLGFTINKQSSRNQLLVADGETSVIGGLTVTTVTKSRSGIPLLSGLPIVGKLFSFSSEQENRRDLIILVTPRIVDDGITTP
jgi:type IV pilus assembly protein PilQ